MRDCPHCGGRGWVEEPGPEPYLPNQIPCQHCEGTGKIAREYTARERAWFEGDA